MLVEATRYCYAAPMPVKTEIDETVISQKSHYIIATTLNRTLCSTFESVLGKTDELQKLYFNAQLDFLLIVHKL